MDRDKVPQVVKWRDAILNESDLPTYAVLVALAMSHWMNKDAYTFVSLNTLAKATRTSKMTVKKYVDVLVAEGWLVRSHKGLGHRADSVGVIPDRYTQSGPLPVHPGYTTSDGGVVHLSEGGGTPQRGKWSTQSGPEQLEQKEQKEVASTSTTTPSVSVDAPNCFEVGHAWKTYGEGTPGARVFCEHCKTKKTTSDELTTYQRAKAVSA